MERSINEIVERAREIREIFRNCGLPMELLDNEQEFDELIKESCRIAESMGVKILYN